jgi:hypothetical protein
MLGNIFPDNEWLPWKHEKVPATFWDDLNNQRKFFDWASKELKIKETSDWYKVTLKVT